MPDHKINSKEMFCHVNKAKNHDTIHASTTITNDAFIFEERKLEHSMELKRLF